MSRVRSMSRAIATWSAAIEVNARSERSRRVSARRTVASVEITVEVEHVGLDGHRPAAERRPRADPGRRRAASRRRSSASRRRHPPPGCSARRARRGWRWAHRDRRRGPRLVRRRPSSTYGCPSIEIASAKLPAATAVANPPRRDRPATSRRRRHRGHAEARAARPGARGTRGCPRGRCPSAKPGPTMSRRIPRLSVRVAAKRSALQVLNSRVNGMTSTRSAPHCPSSSTRSSRLESSGGQPGGIDDAARMRIERDRDGGHRPARGHGAHALEQALMPDVDAVEAADRHHRPWAARLPRGELMEQFHRDVSRPAPWSAGAGRR